MRSEPETRFVIDASHFLPIFQLKIPIDLLQCRTWIIVSCRFTNIMLPIEHKKEKCDSTGRTRKDNMGFGKLYLKRFV